MSRWTDPRDTIKGRALLLLNGGRAPLLCRLGWHWSVERFWSSRNKGRETVQCRRCGAYKCEASR